MKTKANKSLQATGLCPVPELDVRSITMKPYLTTVILLFISIAHLSAEEPNDWVLRYKPIAVEGRFAAYMGPSPIVLDAKLRAHSPKTYLDFIQYFGPAFIHNLSGGGMWEWHFDDGRVLRCGPPSPGKNLSDFIEASLSDSNLIKTGTEELTIDKKQSPNKRVQATGVPPVPDP